jgi:hypothetical protein
MEVLQKLLEALKEKLGLCGTVAVAGPLPELDGQIGTVRYAGLVIRSGDILF